MPGRSLFGLHGHLQLTNITATFTDGTFDWIIVLSLLFLLPLLNSFFALPPLFFPALHLLDQEVLVQELGKHLFGELAPKLRHEVPRRQVLRRL